MIVNTLLLRRALGLLFALLGLIRPAIYGQKFSGTFTFYSRGTGKMLDGDNSRVYPSNANGGAYQTWYIRATDVQVNGLRTYTIRSSATGKCLDGDPGKLYVSDCNGGNYQKWIIEPADARGFYTVTSVATGKRLDGNAEQLYPNDPSGNDYQKWALRADQPRFEAPPAYPQSQVGTAVSTAPPARNVAPPAYPDSDPRRVNRYLRRNMTFAPGSSVESKNGRYQVYFQEDGNMVIYRLTDRPKKALWASNTVISDIGKFSFQDDGNLVIYNRNGQAVWATGTDGRGAYMLLQNDGNLVIYNQEGVAIWASNTNE